MTPAEQAGQLVMVGLPSSGSSRAAAAQVATQHLGGVVLLGGWSGATTVSAAVGRVQSAARGAGMPGVLVAADQEGGAVQQLRGAGFGAIPSARVQASWPLADLTAAARRWAGELRAAGVTVDLSPVADTVPPALGSHNQPIGRYGRDFVPGDPARNAVNVAAVVTGVLEGGVAPTLKHFPGLGRVTGNTDVTASGTTDSTTAAGDPYLQPFAAGIRAGAPLVMVSSARYPRIDPDHQAMFSGAVVTGLLRQRIGFRGVVVSDDMGAARAVAGVPVSQRVVLFVGAGGDIALTAAPGQAPTMVAALTARMRTSGAFAARVRAATERVLALKLRLGLVSC
jgi:beta-N-acetylhexosaminidase